MDLKAAMGQFFDDKGQINLPEQLTLAGLCETLYMVEAASGGADRECLRFWDYSANREGDRTDYSRKQINTRIKAVAARLQQIGTLGDRVAVLAGNSPEYMFGFLGAMYAGMAPIPLYDPTEPGHGDHLTAVLADCEPKFILTNSASAAAVRKLFASRPAAERPRILTIDALPDSLAESFVNPLETEAGKQLAASSTSSPLDLVAFLQYTSGSTRTPAGVVLTNRNIMTNVLQIFTAANFKLPLRVVSWLPLHHDMGIILAAFCIILGLKIEMMNPRDFIQQPSRWLEQISAGDEGEHTYTIVPNFALELAVRYGRPAEGQALDLSRVDGLIIGSEPVTPKAINQFIETFGGYGLDTTAIRPSYGLAEASLIVSTPMTENRPVITWVDRERLNEGTAVVVDGPADNAAALVSNGQVARPQQLVIVDPETRCEVPDGTVGEIWTHGDNTAAGYLDRPEDTAETFRNTLAGRLPENSRAEGAPDDDRWMATGDLGLIVDNELYITGRRKDLIIIAGRNHYPQDIEYTVDHASDHIRPAAIAAFAVPGDDVEKLVIIAERDLGRDADGDAAAVEAIRTAVSSSHGVVPADIVIVGPDEIKRSSSGKIARRVCSRDYLA
ncbi:FadD32-like long-chain-fatty-acid--AMP ligase [Corynebacterium sp. TAE3-ERU16]|uniref:FadD32-like long-chain-fatty-acid--AMP ligase n=1 Tax=Corynebacterium sp. TAE3-ERU16 TaxID=2849493 RepID=UPI001C49698D|nr:FadD32-like long-chain-fatty-acid--AMP ligase [Corynebacterium sp. TAE3-ERU16]MBV7294213.1 AMP-binding protein [Corynebacterium sp. TAE3-ERU16]